LTVQEKRGLDLRGKGNEMALQRLRDAAERAKIELRRRWRRRSICRLLRRTRPGRSTWSSADSGQARNHDRRYFAAVGGAIEAVLEGCGRRHQQDHEVVLVGGQTRMPRIQAIVKNCLDATGTRREPDEVVAIGAAIQGGVLGGEVKDLLLLDVTPLTLSIETLGGVATAMIPRNTTIPTKKTETFSTAADSQTSVECTCYRANADGAQNRTLGKFHLTGLHRRGGFRRLR